MENPAERIAFFMNKVLDYWKSQPGRALHGWARRLQHFLGFHTDAILGVDKKPPKKGRPWLIGMRWGPEVHPWAVLGFIVLIAIRLRQAGRAKAHRLESFLSLGMVASLWFVVYVGIHSLFSYTGFRYVTGCLPILAAAIAMLASEIWPTERHPFFRSGATKGRE